MNLSVHRSLQDVRARGEKAMGLFLTSGFPEPAATLGILEAVGAHADFIELGMPFSDPLAEGLPIQRSSARALAHGIRMTDTLRTAEAFRARVEKPLLLMGYINPVLYYGLERFCTDAAAAGVSGLILPDAPPEEGARLEAAAAGAGLELVYLIAPTSPDARIEEIDRRATGFVYAVSVTGLTGTGLGEVGAVERYLAHARTRVQRNPLLVGFGIRTAEDARRLTRHADGFIVGSALIGEVERLWDDPSLDAAARLGRLETFARALRP